MTITFIIPTIGRNSLKNSILSIQNQTNSNWKIIVVFDGIQSTVEENEKMKTICIDKTGIDHPGQHGRAGKVRNAAFDYVSTELIAFLDDDDIITPDYVEFTTNEFHNNPCVDIVINSLKKPNGKIIPNKTINDIVAGQVGISFCIKSRIINGIRFQNDTKEDFLFLNDLKQKGYNYKFTHRVCYLVGAKL